MKKLFWSLILSLLFPTLALAGVVLTDAQGGKTYIENGRLKHVDTEGRIEIFHATTGEMFLIDANRKLYARGTVADFCKAGKGMMDAAMSKIPPEQREMMKQYMGNMGAKRTPPKVTVAMVGGGGNVAGFATTKYAVKVDGRPYQDLWLANDRTLMKELQSVEKLLGMSAEMASCMGSEMGGQAPLAAEGTPAYQALFKKGYPLKSVSLEEGTPTVQEEVVRVEKRKLSAADFTPPTGYREVSFAAFVTGG